MKQAGYSDELKMEVVVGAFMVMVFLGLGYFTIILSRDKWFGDKYNLTVKFQRVMGLREGDNVVARGMPVGKIKTLTLDPDGVRVVASLDQQLHIREKYRMTIVNTSMLGGRQMEVDEGPLSNPEVGEDVQLVGETPVDLLADAAEVMSELKKGLTTGGVISNIQNIASQLSDVSTRLNAGKGTLGKLLSEDDTLYKDLSGAVASLKNVAERVDKGEGTMGKLLSSDDKLYQDLSAAVASLKSIAAQVDKGEGTIGKLIKDDTVYEEVKKAIGEVRSTIDDYRETAPVVTFTSIFFGAF
jgi:phospholipid/cholesterol/gamma-HCH transport system substrate-binding protein